MAMNKSAKSLEPSDYVLIAVIMGLMGAFFWAIRGTGGYGGVSGGALAGLGWAMLWFGFSRVAGAAAWRPYGSGHMVAAIAFGIAYGGSTGYGVYTAWVNGLYQMNGNEVTRDIAPWTGYAMLFLCGIHWGGVTGAFMAWCAPKTPPGWIGWALRVASGVGGAVLGVYIVRWFPQYFLPFYSEGYYQNEAYVTSIRALRSLPNVTQHVGLFAGFLAFEIARRDWRAVRMMMVMSIGFALPFAVGGYWHTMRGSALHLDWWKNWEMTIGLGGGLAFGLAFYLFNQPEHLAAPRAATRLERIFGVGLTLWMLSGMVILGAYEGFIRSRGLEASLEASRNNAFWAYLVLATLFFVYWVHQTWRIQREVLGDPSFSPLPLVAVLTMLGIIVVAGYVTSVPAELRLANKVLLTLYTVYIGTSLVLFLVLRKRLPHQAG